MLPRTSQLTGRSTVVGSGGGTGRTSNLQEFGANMTWSDLYTSAQDLARVRNAVSGVLGEDLHKSFVGVGLRPALVSLESMMENSASKQFGLLGRMALVSASPEEAGKILKLPQQVLVFAVHSCIQNAGYLCTGSANQRFEEGDPWPNSLPPGWSDAQGMNFAFRYRLKAEMSDKLLFKGQLVGDTVVASVQNPYDTSKKPVEIHLRVTDFVKSKQGAAPDLPDSKARELIGIVEQYLLQPFRDAATMDALQSGSGYGGRQEMFETGSSVTAARESNLQVPRQSALLVGNGGRGGDRYTQPLMAVPVMPMMGGGGGRNPTISGGFQGDLDPMGGGQQGASMLFGPGNPQFDTGGSANYMPQRGGRGGNPNVPPGARFDPYGPPMPGGAPTRGGPRRSQFGGDPDPDEFLPPGNNNMYG